MKRELAEWESWEALEECMRRDGPRVAKALHRSESLVQKWKEKPGDEVLENSGARNPLDRVELIIATIEKIDPNRAYVPIKWLNARFGFFPPVKMPVGIHSDDDVMRALLDWNKEFGETNAALSESFEDRRITQDEFKKIEREMMEDVIKARSLLELLRGRVCD